MSVTNYLDFRNFLLAQINGAFDEGIIRPQFFRESSLRLFDEESLKRWWYEARVELFAANLIHRKGARTQALFPYTLQEWECKRIEMTGLLNYQYRFYYLDGRARDLLRRDFVTYEGNWMADVLSLRQKRTLLEGLDYASYKKAEEEAGGGTY